MEIKFENGSYIKSIKSDEIHRSSSSEIIYRLPEHTDEEIKSFFEENGITDINPEDVRKYIREEIYRAFCEAMDKNK